MYTEALTLPVAIVSLLLQLKLNRNLHIWVTENQCFTKKSFNLELKDSFSTLGDLYHDPEKSWVHIKRPAAQLQLKSLDTRTTPQKNGKGKRKRKKHELKIP